MPFAENQGASLYFEAHGEGEPVLLVPGLGLTVGAWAQVTPRLAESHRVVLVDPRGAGLSDTPDIPYTGKLLAEDLCAVLDEAAVRRAHVVGLSMGGMMAQELAIGFPERVASLILLSTYAATDDWSRRLFEVRKLMIERLGLIDHFKLSIMFVFSPAAFRTMKGRVEAIERTLTTNPPDKRAYLRQVQFCLDHDTVDRLSAIAAPTLVVTGSHDILTSPLQGRDLAAWIPGAAYREYPGASHGLWMEQGDAFVDLVREWTGQHSLNPSETAT